MYREVDLKGPGCMLWNKLQIFVLLLEDLSRSAARCIYIAVYRKTTASLSPISVSQEMLGYGICYNLP